MKYEVYDWDHDKSLGIFADYDDAECVCAEYVNNFGEPVEATVYEVTE